MSQERKIDLLLSVLHAHARVDALLHRGYEYHQIMHLIDQAQQADLVHADEKGVRLTPLGLERVAAVRLSGFSTQPDFWIVPEAGSAIEQHDRWEVYLPPKTWKVG